MATTLPVVFNDAAWAEDLDHATEPARAVADTARRRLERDGVSTSELRPCRQEGPLALPRCAKLYLPPPAGRWGLVLRLAVIDDNPVFTTVAFGVRHPTAAHRPSVYAIAHERVCGS